MCYTMYVIKQVLPKGRKGVVIKMIITNEKVRNIQQVRNLVWDTNKPIKEVVVLFSKKNWNKTYTGLQRMYALNLSSSGFNSEGSGQAIIGNCLDGSDQNVRLDMYNWDVEAAFLNIE